jgi:hypothetical protein
MSAYQEELIAIYQEELIATLNRTIELALLECERLRCRLRSNHREIFIEQIKDDIVDCWEYYPRRQLCVRKLWTEYHRYSEPLPAWLWEGLA